MLCTARNYPKFWLYIYSGWKKRNAITLFYFEDGIARIIDIDINIDENMTYSSYDAAYIHI